MRNLFFLLLSLMIFSACEPVANGNDQSVDTASTTIFLVRHAEKETGDDPGLTPEGLARAQKLAEMLSKVEVDAVFSTNYRRTRLTAEPVAQQNELTIEQYDPKDLPAFAEQLKERFAGKTVLVVGHSNTTPTLTGHLDGVVSFAPFDESDYGNLMQVVIPPTGPAKTLQLRF